MSDSEKDPLRGLLSEFALGPAWARAGGDKADTRPKTQAGGEERPARRDNREHSGNRERDGGGRRPPPGRGGNYEDRRSGPPQREEAPPAEGVRVSLAPDSQAIHLIGKEVHQVARVYPLFDVAQILLAERGRCRAIFEVEDDHPPMLLGKLDASLFLTREEAVRHIWESDFRPDLIEEETIEVDPPSGNFQTVARCGMSGEWLGPPNFHSYQTNLRRLHRERFAHMPFEVYASRVRSERGEEAVNGWLETMKRKTRWRVKGAEDDPWIDDRGEAERLVGSRCLEKAFTEVRKAEVSAAIPGKSLSPSLLTLLRMAGSHARKHPAILIPAVCRALEAEHLPVFKRQGKLHTGPARPHSLAPNTVLAARPAAMVDWIRNNKPAKLAGLWKTVLPEGATEPTPDFAADLFWLLHQGHILLYADDTLMVQEAREATPPKKKKEPKKPERQETPETAPADFQELVSADVPDEAATIEDGQISFDPLPSPDETSAATTTVEPTMEAEPLAIEGFLEPDESAEPQEELPCAEETAAIDALLESDESPEPVASHAGTAPDENPEREG